MGATGPILARPLALVRRALFGLLAVSACRTTATGDTSLFLYREGVRTELTTSVPALLEACERRVAQADGVLRLAVTPEMLDDLRKHRAALEIEYAAERTFVLPALQGRQVTARRLLIPLSGELAGEITTVFVDSGDGYAAGPLRASAATAELARLAQFSP